MSTRLYPLLIVLLLALSACAQSTPADDQDAPSSEAAVPTDGAVVKGYGISPYGFPQDYSQYAEFLEEVGSLPYGGVMYNGAWRDDVDGGSDSGEIPQTAASVMRDSETFGYIPIIVMGWRSDEQNLHIGLPDNPVDDWTNEEAKAAFEQMLVAYASEYHPPFLFLGNESDAYYTADAEDYARWVAFYNRAYDAVKAVSPHTRVGPILQYERLSGQGATNGWTEPQWGALDLHDLDRIDILGLTMYPWLGFSTPEDIPDDYLAPILERIGNLPIAITETGWPGEALAVGAPWEQSPEAQMRYIDALERILEGVNIKMLNWLHLHPLNPFDRESNEYLAFGAISLYDQDGNRRPVYQPWIEFQP